MGKISKTLAVFLTLIIALSCLTLLTVKSVNAQTIPKPAVPEFTLKFVSHPYDVPTTTTTTIDPYTGEKTVTTHSGYHVENSSLEFHIKNQPFIPYYDGETLINLYYNISYKGHFEDAWKYYSSYTNDGYHRQFFSQSQSNYTIITFELDLPEKGQVDFRVQAQIGHYGDYITYGGRAYSFSGQVSGWSTTQTLTLPEESSSSPTPTTTPTVPELSWLAIIPMFVAVLSFALILRHRKNVSLSK